jgi:hypothetical protein
MTGRGMESAGFRYEPLLIPSGLGMNLCVLQRREFLDYLSDCFFFIWTVRL